MAPASGSVFYSPTTQLSRSVLALWDYRRDSSTQNDDFCRWLGDCEDRIADEIAARIEKAVEDAGAKIHKVEVLAFNWRMC